MKRYFLTKTLFLFLGFGLLTNLCYSSNELNTSIPLKFESAIEYNDFIINNQTKIIRSFLNLANLAGTEEFAKHRKETLSICDKAIKEVASMGDYDGDTKFRDAAVNLFKFYKRIITNEFNEMNTLLMDENFDEKSLQKITELQEQVSQEEMSYDNQLQKCQGAFASKHGFEIEKSELQDAIDKM